MKARKSRDKTIDTWTSRSTTQRRASLTSGATAGGDNCRMQHQDASQYAHYVFNTMKRKPSGKISFEEFLTILSKVSRGSVEEKLQWVFGLYDLDGDGLISKEEMLDVVGSIYEMLGRYTQPQILEPHVAAREHVDRIFHLMDANKDGVVTIEELVQWCSKDEQLLRSLDTLDTVL